MASLKNLKIDSLENPENLNFKKSLGFEALIKSKLFPNLIDLRLDMNKIDDTKQLAYSCSLDKI